VATAAVHGKSRGLLVVTVMTIVLPESPEAGVYVNEKGVAFDEAGLTEPAPFSVIVTLVALPPNEFPVTVTGKIPHVVPLLVLKVTVGGFRHPQDTWKPEPVVVHPAAFLTVIE
jgi:hypothetical protein